MDFNGFNKKPKQIRRIDKIAILMIKIICDKHDKRKHFKVKINKLNIL